MTRSAARIIGRYALHGEIAAGGMATVHFGRLLGPVGFSRTVAIKRLHPQFAKDPEFVSMFLDEARLAARIQHPNVVATLDVVTAKGELFLVMEYVPGETLSRLLRRAIERGSAVPPRIAAAIMCGVLQGLHAAHEAKNHRGEPLSIVHRDVSPQNVLVGVDGTAKVVDFGVAKASGRAQHTADGVIKGKVSYMAPEQIQGSASRQSDVYAAGVVTWELLVGQRLFVAENNPAVLAKVLAGNVTPPSQIARGVPAAFDEVVMRALRMDPRERFETAREMAIALEKCDGLATPSEVSDWVIANAPAIAEREEAIAEIESGLVEVPNSDGLLNRLNRMSSAPPPGPASTPTITAAQRVTVPFLPPARVALEPSAAAVTAQAPLTPSEPATTVTRSSFVSMPDLAPPRRFGWAPWLASGAVVFTCLVLLARHRGTGAEAIDGARPSAAAASQPALAHAPPAPTPEPASMNTSEPVAPAPSAPAPAAVEPAAGAKRTSASRPAAKPAAAPPPVKKPPLSGSCNPPYEIDAAGHKKYKLQCL